MKNHKEKPLNLTGPIDPTINPVQISDQKASLVINLARVDFLESLGGHSLTDMFTAGPAAPFTATSFKRAEVVTTIYVGAYLTPAREFAELGQPLLVKWAFQATPYFPRCNTSGNGVA